MFEQLSDKLNTTFERLRGRARVSESDLEAVSYTHLTLPTILRV